MSHLEPAPRAAPRTRRGILRAGAVVAATAAFGVADAGAQSATPPAGAAIGPVLFQAFAYGTLFRTQGSGPELPPYTLIVWGAIGGFAAVDPAGADAAILPTDRSVDALAAASPPPTVILVASPAEKGDASGANEEAWALTLAHAGLGSDPDAVTYQGALLEADDARARFGLTVSEPPSLVKFGPGYLVVAGVAGLAPASLGGVRFSLS